MLPNESRAFRLTVLNAGGRDPEQYFTDGAGEAGGQHAPVNFHAFAACTGGSFQRDARKTLAQDGPALVLLRGDLKASQRALTELKRGVRPVAVSLKETGLHQIAQQLRDAAKLARFTEILAAADGCIATTPEAAEVCRSVVGLPNGEKVAFIPTPYPVGDARWDFSRPGGERGGIFIGTREWNVPARNHLAAMLAARRLSEETGETVTVFNGDGRAGMKFLQALKFPARKLRVIDRRLSYADYLRAVGQHKIVFQLDTSFVPGQVAGDALLCRMPCVGGNGAIDRLAFSGTCGWGRSIGEIMEIAAHLLQDSKACDQAAADAQRCALAELSFARIAKKLQEFFRAIQPRASK